MFSGIKLPFDVDGLITNVYIGLAAITAHIHIFPIANKKYLWLGFPWLGRLRILDVISPRRCVSFHLINWIIDDVLWYVDLCE